MGAESESTVRTQESQVSGGAQKALALSWVFPTHAAPLQCLSESRYVIGRGPDCTIRLDSASVSRRHVEVYRQGPIFSLRDLGSKNGVHLDGERIAHAPLREGQVLRVGDYVAVITSIDRSHQGEFSSFEELGPGLFGGAALSAVLQPVKLAARHDLPVVIEGETGTGKELVARSIHAWSGRVGPFYAVNCAALPLDMVDGELFGYRKGAFTGASQSHLGHLRAAHGGTLFLDEVSELPLEVQAKLLRALQEREIIPLGENRPVPIDVRVACACQKPLMNAVQSGAFRADLHARLAGYSCVVPPLRERPEEVPMLFAMFVHRSLGGRPPAIDAKLIEQLLLYNWPDNVRELELLSRRLAVLHGHESVLQRAHLPKHLLKEPAARTREPDEGPPGDRREYELKRLVSALQETRGNLAKAAASLGFSRQRAYRLMGDRSVKEILAGDVQEKIDAGEANGANGA